MITRLSDEQGYAAEVAISAPIERVCSALCTRGWDHYLDSLTAYVEGKGGF